MRSHAIITPQRYIGTTGKRLRKGIASRMRGDPEREAYKDAQILADLLLANPQANMYGLYYITLAEVANLTGLVTEEVERALAILEEERYAYYDRESEFVWVREMARVQMHLPLKAGDRVVKTANTWYQSTPRNPFLGPFFDRYEKDLRLEGPKRDEWANRTAPLESSAIIGGREGEASTSTPLFQAWFLIFLEAYPASRRVGGAAGETAFRKAMHGRGQEQLNAMLDSLWYQRRSKQWREGVIPSMVKWLEEEQWVRDLPAAVSVKMQTEAWHCEVHRDCRSPGEHAMRVGLDQQCAHVPKCRSFIDHYNREVDSEAVTP